MLILLDIDGVMVHAKPWSSPKLLEDGFTMFSPQAVKALNKIIMCSKARIILTTSHKHSFSLSDWKKIFKSRGVLVNLIDRLPKNSTHQNRKEEITNWHLNNKGIKDFVILDDDSSLNDLEPFLKSQLVSTKPLIGLTMGHVEEALRILNTPLELA